jgi:hypothetical protein
MEQPVVPTRADVCANELTRDPVFLFQRKQEALVDGDETCVGTYWHTERVFGTRQEGEAFGRDRAHDYPDGWRVYCVPCEGMLARTLRLLLPEGDPRK